MFVRLERIQSRLNVFPVQFYGGSMQLVFIKRTSILQYLAINFHESGKFRLADFHLNRRE